MYGAVQHWYRNLCSLQIRVAPMFTHTHTQLTQRQQSVLVLYKHIHTCTDMCRLTTGIRSDKCVVTRFRRENVTECTYTNLDIIAYYAPRLYGIAYCS
jgi:hypothetical protein